MASNGGRGGGRRKPSAKSEGKSPKAKPAEKPDPEPAAKAANPTQKSDPKAPLKAVGKNEEIELAHRASSELRAAAELMAEAQRVANFGSWEWRVGPDEVTWSEQLYRIFGEDPATFEATFDGYLEHVHPDHRNEVRETIQAAVQTQRPYRFEHRIVRPSGEERKLRCHGEPVAEGGRVVRVVGVCQDITELADTERERDVADERFRSAFENAPIGIALVDFSGGPQGRLTEVNRSLGELTGRSERELAGLSLTDLSLSEDADLDLALRERLVAGEIDRFSIEKRALFEDRLVWLQLSISILPAHDDEPHVGIVQVQDVTERKRFEDQLRYIADHDSLTGLMNRRRLREELESQLALVQRYGGEGALLLLDVDRLKAINDTHGHSAGDMLLRRVAEVMRSRMRSTDSVARLSGDEFAIVLPNVQPGQASVLAEELITRLAAEKVASSNISVSIGVAPFGHEGAGEPGTVEEITAAADAALYRAKQRGGGASEVARELHPGGVSADTPGEEAEAPAPPPLPASLVDRVRAALADDRLLLYGQPAVDLRSGGVAHREVLIRMRDESGAILAASDFLAAAAQEQGLVMQIDRWVVDHALAMLQNGARGSRLQVNLSGETLADLDSIERIARKIGAAQAAAPGLALEIAEGSVTRDVNLATDAVTTLAEAGCPIVLDGFSGAFGSFEYLQRLPLDQVKIDATVTRALLGEQPDHATMRAIVRLAHGTGKSTVAKLVESDTLVPILRMHGVDMAQGWEFGEPVPL